MSLKASDAGLKPGEHTGAGKKRRAEELERIWKPQAKEIQVEGGKKKLPQISSEAPIETRQGMRTDIHQKTDECSEATIRKEIQVEGGNPQLAKNSRLI